MSNSGARWQNLKLRIGQRLLTDPKGEMVEENAHLLRKVTTHKMYEVMRVGPLCEESWQRVSDSVALARTMYKDEALLKEMLRHMDGIAAYGLMWLNIRDM